MPGARRLRRRARRCAQVFERYRPQVRLPRRRLQARADARDEPARRRSRTTCSRRATIAEVAVEFGVERFVLISTDKAANPKNLLGQSKAVCEWIVESFALRDDVATRFVAVRFGNVLGSSGSVIPIFRRQIERGGPVTVTNPEMTRFFMTIPEAASLVVQAGAMGGRGQVYVLDMGEPVKILDLARQMIRLSGKHRGARSRSCSSGVRPGEKLHEELWNDGEAVGPTSHPKIMRAARAADRRALARGASSPSSSGSSARATCSASVAKLRQMVAAPSAHRRRRCSKTRSTEPACRRPACRSTRLCRAGRFGAAGRRRGRVAAVDVLDGLNPEQRRAAEAVRGPVCILAGRGLGQDDDDHAADRPPGRVRRVRARSRSSR